MIEPFGQICFCLLWPTSITNYEPTNSRACKSARGLETDRAPEFAAPTANDNNNNNNDNKWPPPPIVRPRCSIVSALFQNITHVGPSVPMPPAANNRCLDV